MSHLDSGLDIGTDFMHSLSDAVRKNPVSAALIGMGALWLFTGGRPVTHAAELARRSGLDRLPEGAGDLFEAGRSSVRSGIDAIGDGVGSARDAGAAALDRASRAGSDVARSATAFARTIPQSGSELFDGARNNLRELFKAQPLALGAIGLAIGAGIAAALPVSDVEQEYLGEASDAVKAKASEFVSEQGARAVTVAENVAGAATEEARRQGLTMQDAKAAVGELSGKVGRMADAAGNRTQTN